MFLVLVSCNVVIDLLHLHPQTGATGAECCERLATLFDNRKGNSQTFTIPGKPGKITATGYNTYYQTQNFDANVQAKHTLKLSPFYKFAKFIPDLHLLESFVVMQLRNEMGVNQQVQCLSCHVLHQGARSESMLKHLQHAS